MEIDETPTHLPTHLPVEVQGGDATPPATANRVLGNFLVGERLKQIPARRKKLLVVLEWLAEGFLPGVLYAEREVNERLLRHHPDFATLRRMLVDYGYLERDHGVYWRPAAAATGEQPAPDQPEGGSAGLEETRPQSNWYAMLFPTHEESARLAVELGKLAELTGGEAYPSIHVTVGYFVGDVAPSDVVELARGLDRPAITVRAPMGAE